MRESLLRRRGPWRFDDPTIERSTKNGGRKPSRFRPDTPSWKVSRVAIALTTAVLLLPASVSAQSPWERAASNLEQTFTGPLARSLALVAIVIGGLMFMFGEGGAKRQISGIVFGGGLALFAGQFLLWLF
ncbi:MAG: TrbC/VirB2 family protein [Vicinamibacterales bacterium]